MIKIITEDTESKYKVTIQFAGMNDAIKEFEVNASDEYEAEEKALSDATYEFQLSYSNEDDNEYEVYFVKPEWNEMYYLSRGEDPYEEAKEDLKVIDVTK